MLKTVDIIQAYNYLGMSKEENIYCRIHVLDNYNLIIRGILLSYMLEHSCAIIKRLAKQCMHKVDIEQDLI